MVDEVLKLLATWHQRTPCAWLPAELNALFKALQSADPAEPAYLLEDRIWELWTAHPDPERAAGMDEAIAAIAARRFADADKQLALLLAVEPGWPEVWNKRATLRFLENRDAESVADIRQTLHLEPRHFGAISGFAQICLRRRQPEQAALALETALAINPHLEAPRTALAALSAHTHSTRH